MTDLNIRKRAPAPRSGHIYLFLPQTLLESLEIIESSSDETTMQLVIMRLIESQRRSRAHSIEVDLTWSQPKLLLATTSLHLSTRSVKPAAPLVLPLALVHLPPTPGIRPRVRY